ncbi:MAG TPA: hypothetical protein VJT84_05875 [Gaiellaceae bacterium]|nr:hypothetical protein [Gaiellaceae bacterium]
MELEEVGPGLRRWVAFHPEWKEAVACYAVETRDGLVLVDPLNPPRELGTPEHVLLTVYWHARSARHLRAKRVWAPARSLKPLERRGITVTDPLRPGDTVAGGIQALASGRASELVYYLGDQRALVLVSHGKPVLRGGRAALQQALRQAPSAA